MEIKRYAHGGVQSIKISGKQGYVRVSSPGEGRPLEFVWCRLGSWKHEPSMLNGKGSNYDSGEPFKDILLKGIEIAQQWHYNANYYYQFPEDKKEA